MEGSTRQEVQEQSNSTTWAAWGRPPVQLGVPQTERRWLRRQKDMNGTAQNKRQ